MSTLVVVSPGLSRRRRPFRDIRDRLESMRPAHEFVWEFVDHRKSIWSLGTPATAALDLVGRIDRAWARANGAHQRIIFVGYSAGGILVRLAYLIGAGVYEARPGPGPLITGLAKRPWHDAVRGLVLIAGVNAGWNAPGWFVPVVRSAEAAGLDRRLFAGHLIRGSTFVTNVRIDWLQCMTELGERAPRVLQIVGTRDSIVGDADSRDLTQFPRAIQELVPEAGHMSIMRRTDQLTDAIVRFDVDNEEALAPAAPEPSGPTAPRRVVFAVHGIRDSRHSWPLRCEQAVLGHDPQAEVLRPGFGFFSALRFVWPPDRRRRVRWLCDQYTRARAKYPGAEFHYVGHSNGTYMLGHALARVHGMRFERVVLMNSVLPRDFPWDDLVQRGQVGRVESHRARGDWPVAILCPGLRALGMRDLGTGGFEGFDSDVVHEVFWYQGGHGATVTDPESLARIASFLCGQAPSGGDAAERLPGPSGLMKAAPRWVPLAVWLTAILMLGGSIAWSLAAASIWPVVALVILGAVIAFIASVL